MEKDNKISVEILTIIPRNQFSFQYSFNHGVFHIIKKYDAFAYFKQFVKENNYGLLLDLISRFRPILIIPKENKIIELYKNQDNNEYYRKVIENEIKSAGKNGLKKEEIGRLPNDQKLEDVFKKVKKISKKIF